VGFLVELHVGAAGLAMDGPRLLHLRSVERAGEGGGEVLLLQRALPFFYKYFSLLNSHQIVHNIFESLLWIAYKILQLMVNYNQ
jgi:hypothetical protein